MVELSFKPFGTVTCRVGRLATATKLCRSRGRSGRGSTLSGRDNEPFYKARECPKASVRRRIVSMARQRTAETSDSDSLIVGSIDRHMNLVTIESCIC